MAEEPTAKVATTDVLAAVISRGSEFLICQRPADKRHGGLWEFPGGKIEGDETLEDAARRELAEELGVSVVAVGDSLMSVHDEGSPFNIVFVQVEISGEPTAVEHKEMRWVPRSELVSLPLAPSDARFAAWLQSTDCC